MSATPQTSQQHQSGDPHCSQCDAVLLPDEAFCGTCGAQREPIHPPATIGGRYRITTLLRSQSYIRLFTANDTLLHRMVVIRDINVTRLGKEAKAESLAAVQAEHEILHQLATPHLMQVFDIQHTEGHIYSIAELPTGFAGPQADQQTFYTLDHLLQSGIGLPDEQIAIAWICYLCQALDRLHARQIVIGSLDPYTIIVNTNDYEGLPALCVAWLPQRLHDLLPRAQQVSHFSAPETLREPATDVYSLGALLYLLLTGRAPEAAIRRKQNPLRSPYEMESDISANVSTAVMRALALENEERYQNVRELARELLHPPVDEECQLLSQTSKTQTEHNYEQVFDILSLTPLQTGLSRLQKQSRRLTGKLMPRKTVPMNNLLHGPQEIHEAPPATEQILAATINIPEKESHDYSLADQPTIRMLTILPSVAEEQDAGELPTISLPQVDSAQPEAIESVDDNVDEPSARELREDEATLRLRPLPIHANPPEKHETKEHTVEAVASSENRDVATDQATASHWARQLRDIPGRSRRAGILPADKVPGEANEQSLLKRLQRFFLGEQQHSTTAAALIETPLRVQPKQSYSIRVHIIGRSESKSEHGGLSSMTEGKQIYIEVRSALPRHYVYIVQQADIQLPGMGYAAEITLPMRPLPEELNGRRERLHVQFLDEQHNPLYEKPFIIEIFVSYLVQAGREGHNVLPIPL